MSLLTAKRAHILVVLSCAARVLRRTQREKADDARAPSTLGAVRSAATRGRLCSLSGRILKRKLHLIPVPAHRRRIQLRGPHRTSSAWLPRATKRGCADLTSQVPAPPEPT